MFNDVFENFRKATEATVNLQQEMFKKWMSLWPSPAGGNWADQAQQFQKKWKDTFGDLLKKQSELTEVQFTAGLQNIEKAFQLVQAKSPEELRAKSIELWKHCFDNLRQVYEAQLRGFESALEKWTKTVTKSPT
jgi:hypothetical protein